MSPMTRREFCGTMAAVGGGMLSVAGLLRPDVVQSLHGTLECQAPEEMYYFVVTKVSEDGNRVTVEAMKMPELPPASQQLKSWPPVPPVGGTLTFAGHIGVTVRPGDVLQVSMGWRTA